MPPRKLITEKFTHEEVKNACESSISITEAAQKLGMGINNGVYPRMRQLSEHYKVPLPQWDNRISAARVTAFNRMPDSLFFAYGKKRNGAELKKRLLSLGVTYECAIPECPIIDEWLGKPVSLEVDHINGDRFDNRQDNLRFLCPTCHSQTDTFGVRNKNRYEYCPFCFYSCTGRSSERGCRVAHRLRTGR